MAFLVYAKGSIQNFIGLRFWGYNINYNYIIIEIVIFFCGNYHRRSYHRIFLGIDSDYLHTDSNSLVCLVFGLVPQVFCSSLIVNKFFRVWGRGGSIKVVVPT